MMIARRPVILLSLMLAACSSDFSTAPPDYVAPSPPTEQSVVASAKAVAADLKMTGPPGDFSGPTNGPWPWLIFCLPETGRSNHCQAAALLGFL